MSGKSESLLLAGLATGVVASLLESVPGGAGCLVCAVYLGSGMLAVWHYANTYALNVLAGTAAAMGAGAAALGAVVASGIGYLLALLGARPTLREQIDEALEVLEREGVGMAQIEMMREWTASPAFMTTAVLFGISLVAILGVVGGLIGAGLFKRAGTDESGN